MVRRRSNRFRWVPAMMAALALPACEHLPPSLATPLEQAVASPEKPLPEPAIEAAEAPAAPPRPIRIPEGCEWNLSGLYRLADDNLAAHIFRIEDDGQIAVVSPAGEAASTAAAGEAMRIELRRTPDGFVGGLMKTVTFDGGPSCQVTFEARILSCARTRGLWLSLADDVEIDDRCHVVRPGTSREVELVRQLD